MMCHTHSVRRTLPAEGLPRNALCEDQTYTDAVRISTSTRSTLACDEPLFFGKIRSTLAKDDLSRNCGVHPADTRSRGFVVMAPVLPRKLFWLSARPLAARTCSVTRAVTCWQKCSIVQSTVKKSSYLHDFNLMLKNGWGIAAGRGKDTVRLLPWPRRFLASLVRLSRRIQSRTSFIGNLIIYCK
jgi:hypothetical protein